MGKRVLILGNGFDLANDLPTKYSDFLDFCEKANMIYKFSFNKQKYINNVLNCWEMNKYIKEILSSISFQLSNIEPYYFGDISYEKDITSNKLLDKLYFKIRENIWYKYFSNKILYNSLGKNWVDFEAEIKLCIKYIDENTKYLSQSVEDLFKKYTFIGDENNAKIRYSAFKSAVLKSFKCITDIFDLRKVLYEDLKNFTEALEIYLSFVETIPVKAKLNNIEDNYEHIINFNYTHTYQRIYGKCDDFFHIHGEIHEESNKELNNMVLGIDEYWSEEEQNSHTNFTIFKKFAQRIQKRTGIENYKWFDEIKSDYEKNNDVAKVFIFGHSLDITDKDILYDYLESEATDVTIYCKDEETEGEYIANVIKIIGEKRLLEKVNQYPPKLKFVIQQPMVPIEEKEKDLSTSGAAK